MSFEGVSLGLFRVGLEFAWGQFQILGFFLGGFLKVVLVFVGVGVRFIQGVFILCILGFV